MAYTRAWTTTTPADSDQASTLGAVTRNLRVDIEERMDSVLGAGGWASDPVGTFPRTVVRYLPPTHGASIDGINTVGWFVVGFPSGGVAAVAPLPLSSTRSWSVPVISVPVGATLTKIRAAVWRKTGASAGLLKSYVGLASMVTTPTFTQIGTTNTPTANSTWVWSDTGISSHLMAAGDFVDVLIQGYQTGTAGDVMYGGLEVTFTVPDLFTGL